MRQDMARVPVRDLPVGYERITAPWQDAQRLKAHLARAEQRMEVTIVRPLHADPYDRGQVVAVVKRHKRTRRPVPRWVLPAVLASTLIVSIGVIGYAVKAAVDSVAEAVTKPSSEVIGFLLILALILLLLAGTRSGGGGTFEGTFKGRWK